MTIADSIVCMTASEVALVTPCQTDAQALFLKKLGERATKVCDKDRKDRDEDPEIREEKLRKIVSIADQVLDEKIPFVTTMWYKAESVRHNDNKPISDLLEACGDSWDHVMYSRRAV